MLAKVSSLFSFSLAEIMILVLPVLIVCLIAGTVLSVLKRRFSLKRSILKVAVVLLITASVFINVFGVCYFRYPLEKNMNLEKEPLTRAEIYENAVFVKGRVEALSEKINFDETGASVNPHTWKDLNAEINVGFDRLENEYSFISDIDVAAKKILLSPIMTYTHISGIYIPFTGEANVNTNYPDYVVAFSTAHEMAHQRGIAGEDEANYIAFLACLYSDDVYLYYCAYMNMYDYFLDALLEKDLQMYTYLVENTNEKVLKEMYSYYKFFDKYRDSEVSEFAQNVNDTYIKSMGEEEGTASYGMVVELFAAYNKKNGLT